MAGWLRHSGRGAVGSGLPPGIQEWTPDQDVWELYHLEEDWSQAHDLAAEQPDKLAQMKELFAMEAAKNSVYPVGGGLWVLVLHPELRISTPYREWNFTGDITRMPEFIAPGLGNRNNRVTIDATIPENASGVLYKLGGAGGGLTCYVDDGYICYEYNLFIIQRTKIRSAEKLPTGPVQIVVETTYAEPRPGGPLNIVITANGNEVARGTVPISAHSCSLPTTAWTSGSASAGQCRWTILTGCRSGLPARSVPLM